MLSVPSATTWLLRRMPTRGEGRAGYHCHQAGPLIGLQMKKPDGRLSAGQVEFGRGCFYPGSRDLLHKSPHTIRHAPCLSPRGPFSGNRTAFETMTQGRRFRASRPKAGFGLCGLSASRLAKERQAHRLVGEREPRMPR